MSNETELKARAKVKDKSVETGKTNAGDKGELGDGFISSTAISASGSAPSQTIAFTEENAKSHSIGGSLSLETTVKVGDVKGGIAVSTEHEATWSSSTTKGCEFSGQVPNLPKRPDYMTQEEYGNYDYSWKLVSYEAVINGSTVPVVGYYTKFADRNKIPSSVPTDLDFEEVKSDSITLTWNGGDRAADHYNVYQVSGSGSGKEYNKIGEAAGNEAGVYRFTHENLQQEQSYTYVVAACNADETIRSVYTDEITTTTPVPEFDVTIKLDGIKGEETYLAGSEQTLTASLATQNYPQSEIDQYIWQVNDGSGWKKLPDGADQDSYTWKALLESDGYQYRCCAYVAVDSRLYRLYSEPVPLHVRKANVWVAVSADKKEGAADRSGEFGLAVYNGDVLKLTVQVQAEEGANPTGNLAFVITDRNDASNVREYMVTVSETGSAETECRFSKTGRYTITARYIENERIAGKDADNNLSYYAYDISLSGDRVAGQDMEDAIYGQNWDDVTIENAIAKRDDIESIKESYKNLTDSQKEFVETEAKEKLDGAADTLAAAEAVEKINAIGDITKENAEQKKVLIEEAETAYAALTDTQRTLVPKEAENTLKAAREAYEKTLIPDDTKDPNPGEKEPDNTENPSPGEKEPDNTENPNPGEKEPNNTENLTPIEGEQVKSISGKLGVSKETANKIRLLADSMSIDMDTLLLTENDILKEDSESELKGSKFGELQAKAAKVTSNQVKLTWKKIKDADGYLIYRAECGKKNAYQLVKEVNKGSAKSSTIKKLKKGGSYRFLVRAYKMVDKEKITISASKVVHIVTNGGKKVNAKSINLSKVKKTLKKGKTLKLKASVVKQKKSTPKCRKLAFESSNSKVATVTKSGKVKAEAKGKCTIYIYAHNGLYKQVKITVK